LATLNDPQFIEAARKLAEAALAAGRKDDEAIAALGERVLLRPLTAKELTIVKGTLKDAQAYYDANADAAKKLIEIGESKANAELPAPKLAAMTLVANQLLNLDEALNK
jgi:hypothetical protein